MVEYLNPQAEISRAVAERMAKHEDAIIMASADKDEIPLPTLLTQDANVAVLLHLLFDTTKAQRIAVTRDGLTYWLRVKRGYDDGWQLQIGETEEQSGVRRPIEVEKTEPGLQWAADENDFGDFHVSFTEDSYD